MRLLRRRILLGMARPDRNATETETAKQIADRAFGELHAPFLLDLLRQVDPAPPDHPILGAVRPAPDPLGHNRTLLGRQPRRRTRRDLAGKAGETLGVVPMHPVPQGLPIHPAGCRRLVSGPSFQNKRQRQHPTRRSGIRTPRRSPAKPNRVKIKPRDHNPNRHPIPQICPQEDRILQNLDWQPYTSR